MARFFLTSSCCRKSFLRRVCFVGGNMTAAVCTASKLTGGRGSPACFYALQRVTRLEMIYLKCFASAARRCFTQSPVCGLISTTARFAKCGSASLANSSPGVNACRRTSSLSNRGAVLHASCAISGGGSCFCRTRFRSVSTAVSKDVVLFEHDKGTFFRLLGFFCAGQFLFWVSLAHFAFTGLKETVITQDSAAAAGKDLPKLGGVSLNLGSSKWRYGFTVSCLTVGSLVLVAGSVFARRSVSRVLLHRGGQEVTFTTYYPFGGTSSFSAPLRHVSCVAHRAEAPSMIPLRVKGHAFYFLLDKQGRFHNARLFDVTVGAYRKL